MTHTPAPWHITPQKAAFKIVSIQENRPDYTIALIANINQYKQNEANARLIASAPEILGALKAFLQFDMQCSTSKLSGGDKDFQIAIEQARALIAKATGN